jgi:SAM-dependent methyltransferase
MEASRWDARYAGDAFFYGDAPNDWLVSMERHLPRNGAVLCLAEGEGRNAVFLAQRGHAVTAVDLSPVGVAKTLALAAARGVAVDARVGDLATFEIAPGAWDAVVSIWAHVPRPLRAALHAAVAAGLRPGGALVFEAYHPRQLDLVRAGTAKGGPPTADLLAVARDVAAELAGLDIVVAAERDRDVREGSGHAGVSAVTQVLAVKPRAGAVGAAAALGWNSAGGENC